MFNESSRIMLPLKLCWAWTAWKVQGMTIPYKIVANLIKYEKEHIITYFVFSRATIFSNISIKDSITLNRLYTIIKK